MKSGRPAKFGNVRTVVDNISFASKREAKRYGELKLMLRAGLITDLRLQVRHKLAVNGQHICEYVSDFEYLSRTGERVVEDSKGMATPIFLYKQRMMKAIHGIDVVTV
jgi:hypothetical protein